MGFQELLQNKKKEEKTDEELSDNKAREVFKTRKLSG